MATRTTHAEHEVGRLVPPEGHVTVRLYRIGHGDCFLLAFPGKKADKPVYVLIDCGYKPGSPGFIDTNAKDICGHIREATGGHIDVVVVTHEHQDHVNGFTEANFDGIEFGQCWFAWTEDPEDEKANALRKRFKDRLQLLMGARNHLAADAGTAKQVARIDDFLAFEFGGEEEKFNPGAAMGLLGAAAGAGMSANKRAMKLVRDLSKDKQPKYLRPHRKPVAIPGAGDVRVFTLGPPTDEVLLHSLQPEDGEGYREHAFAANTQAGFFAAAIKSIDGTESRCPFSRRFCVGWEQALEKGQSEQPNQFWTTYYSGQTAPALASISTGPDEVPNGPDWRRIDRDWLQPAEALALDMNNDTNNGSLVLAFELSPGGKVMLFAADAQRGNWISWSQGTWKDGQRTVTAQDLLARTVLYKVGHHGSHNATLKGDMESQYANLDWMGQGEFEGEFTAMITAVRPWAEKQKGWDHPLKAIKDALVEKAGGRVFQTDTDVEKMKRVGPKAVWDEFQMKVTGDRLFIDYEIAIK